MSRLNGWTDSVAGKLAVWLSGLFTVAGLVLTVTNAFLSRPIDLPLEFLASYLFGVLASFMAYVYARLETTLDKQERILSQPAQGVETFSTSKDFIEKLIEITVGAETVSTLNLSPSRGEHQYLDRYFSEVRHYIRNRRSPLTSFRSIASLDNSAKISWVLERSLDLVDTGKVSFAIFPQAEVRSLLHPLSLHITYKHGNPFVFIYPPVDLTGSMDSILIKDPTVARIFLDYFNSLWHRSVVLNTGRQVRAGCLNLLLELDPRLETNPHFAKLKEVAV